MTLQFKYFSCKDKNKWHNSFQMIYPHYLGFRFKNKINFIIVFLTTHLAQHTISDRNKFIITK